MQDKDIALIAEFGDTAKRYCGMIEDIDNLDAFSFPGSFAEIIAELYQKGQRLPVGESFFDHDGACIIDDEQYDGLCSKIAGKFGWRSRYWVIQNPYDREEVRCGDIGDDLAGIYRDLKEYMALYNNGSAAGIAKAAWYWKFNFMSHWGYHATDALRIIHWITFG